jgi:CRISPR-associated protein (TIGR02710 family)
MSQANKKALVLTVGTGDLERQEETLLRPLRKSLQQGEWDKVVLLPSQVTAELAEKVQRQIDASAAEISSLPEAGLENDADRCFAHYNQVLAKLRQEGFQAENIVADFTRGTKAMSAALVLAAVRHNLPHLRYITGERDQRGMVVPGSERVMDLSTTTATGWRLLDQAVEFMRQGHFAAVLELLPDPSNPFSKLYPSLVREAAAWLRPLATFYAEWDRLDYQAAAEVFLPPREDPPESSWQDLYPSSEAVKWVRTLAQPQPEFDRLEDRCRDMARRLRPLCVDILANGERRVEQRQFEDAMIRAYRVVELVGQRRLFEYGLDSSRLPPDHPAVQALQQKLKKENSHGLSSNRDGTLKAGREQVVRLLKRLDDPLWKDLRDVSEEGELKPKQRNQSVLIHGFRAAGPQETERLQGLYDRLKDLLAKDLGSELESYLKTARFQEQMRK